MKVSNFHNKMISKIVIAYDWKTSLNYAQISVVTNDGNVSSFQINGLTEYQLYDDFSGAYIERVKLIETDEDVFLSLDPYNELIEKPDFDQDCL